MEKGWIKLHRKLLENPIISKPAYFTLWVVILLKANHEENKIMWNGGKITIKEGQVLTGRKELSKLTNIPETTIERALSHFEKNGHQIEQQKTTKFRLITVLNWKEYQEKDTKTDNKRTTNGQQTDTNKNVKNVKNEKNIYISDKSLKVLSPLQEVVNFFFSLKGWNNGVSPPKGRTYASFCPAAKELLELCENDIGIAKEKLQIIKNWADSQELDWSIETVFKRWFELDKLPQEKKKRPRIDGDPAYQRGDKWYVILPNGEHKEWIGSHKSITYE